MCADILPVQLKDGGTTRGQLAAPDNYRREGAMVLSRGSVFDLSALTRRDTPFHLRVLEGGAFVRQLSAGVFSFPALGAKVLHGIESIFADHFRAIGGSEYIFPIIQPISLWKNSGRVDRFGSTMFPNRRICHFSQ